MPIREWQANTARRRNAAITNDIRGDTRRHPKCWANLDEGRDVSCARFHHPAGSRVQHRGGPVVAARDELPPVDRRDPSCGRRIAPASPRDDTTRSAAVCSSCPAWPAKWTDYEWQRDRYIPVEQAYRQRETFPSAHLEPWEKQGGFTRLPGSGDESCVRRPRRPPR
jgi:hypothetical protein